MREKPTVGGKRLKLGDPLRLSKPPSVSFSMRTRDPYRRGRTDVRPPNKSEDPRDPVRGFGKKKKKKPNKSKILLGFRIGDVQRVADGFDAKVDEELVGRKFTSDIKVEIIHSQRKVA